MLIQPFHLGGESGMKLSVKRQIQISFLTCLRIIWLHCRKMTQIKGFAMKFMNLLLRR